VSEQKTVIVVGASSDREKFGNKSVRAHQAGGWQVYPVNPKGGRIEGLTAYRRIADVPGTVDRISMYVPAEVGLGLLDEIAEKQAREFFLNPGSESEVLIEAARSKGLEPLTACSIVDLGMSPSQFDS
jgi:hypothetical protein